MAAKQKSANDILSEDPDDGRLDLINAFISRNRDALNTSLRDARLELEQGGQTGQTVEGIIAAGLKRYNAT